MTQSAFDRWAPNRSYSLPFARFRRDFTVLNNYYWGVAASVAAVGGKLRHLTDTDDFRAELGLNRPRFAKPLGHVTAIFRKQVGEGEAWHRSAVLVMLASAFERYMAAATSLAAASNPTLSPSHLLDGLALLKHKVRIAERDLVDVVKGTWSARASAYSQLFGANEVLDSHIGVLDRMRTDRNDIAHSFGAQLQSEALSPHAALLVGAARTASAYGNVSVSENRLVNLFDSVHSVAEAVDRQLMASHIGSYEVAALLLEWEPDPEAFEQACGTSVWDARKSRDRNAKRFLTMASGGGVTLEYVMSLKTYIGQL